MREGVADRGDGRFQPRRDILVDDRTAAFGRDLAAFGRFEDAPAKAALGQILGLDRRAVMEQLARDREVLNRAFVHRPEHVEGRIAPAQDLVAGLALNPEHVDHDFLWEGPGEIVDRIERALGDEAVDHLLGFFRHVFLDRLERPRRQRRQQRLTQLAVFRWVGRKAGALERVVHAVVERDLGRGEDLGVVHRVTHVLIAGDRPDLIGFHPDHRRAFAQLGVDRIGVEQRLIREKIHVARLHGVVHRKPSLGMLGCTRSKRGAVPPGVRIGILL